MEFNETKRPDPPLTLEEEHKWIDYCRHIPVTQELKNKADILHMLRNIVEQVNQYNTECVVCEGMLPLELSFVTSKRGRITLEPIDAIESIDHRLKEIDR